MKPSNSATRLQLTVFLAFQREAPDYVREDAVRRTRSVFITGIKNSASSDWSSVLSETGRIFLNAGFAGAMNQTLSPGTLFLADTVLSEYGPPLQTDTRLNTYIAGHFSSRGLKFAAGRLLSVDTAVTDVRRRDALRARHDASAVDMEAYDLLTRLSVRNRSASVLKIISDGADAEASIDYESHRVHLSKRLGDILTHLSRSAETDL
jgi:nucleoside phosphorylase